MSDPKKTTGGGGSTTGAAKAPDPPQTPPESTTSTAAKAKVKPLPKVRCKALINFQLAGRPPGTIDEEDKGTPTLDVIKGDVISLSEPVAKSRIKLKWVEIYEEAKA